MEKTLRRQRRLTISAPGKKRNKKNTRPNQKRQNRFCIESSAAPAAGLTTPATARMMKRSAEPGRAPAAAELRTFRRSLRPRLSGIVFSAGGMRVGNALTRRTKRRRRRRRRERGKGSERAVVWLSALRARALVGWPCRRRGGPR
ncbi:hypothetical protein VTH06DRAFT_3453 [Thermothelomyces fergusii]